MIYLLDASVLISAHEDYYPIDRIPQFWIWLLDRADAGQVKIPFEIYGEIAIYTGLLKNWITDPSASKKLLLSAQIDPANLNKVITAGYAAGLDDSEVEKIGRDPFLVGYALPYGNGVTVVTKETSAPSKQRANRKVPDVCKTFGVRCLNDFQFYRELDFKIV
ncbi:MAG: DUF4411 family protein [Acidobacteriaceae bacterium]